MDRLINDLDVARPHFVLLGAGASRAAFPNGDKNGVRLPLMADLYDVLDLDGIIPQAIQSVGRNDFEALYSQLSADSSLANVCSEVSRRVFEYFSSLSIPDEPTLYDLLILSLRQKDTIASFNWDPLLWQAAERCRRFSHVPVIAFLHGNVSLGYCRKHKIPIFGAKGHRCQSCGEERENMQLLYPVEKKNYSNDFACSTMWDGAVTGLKHAFIFTIFGYSAPISDVDAVGLLKSGWGSVESRNLEEIEIIDILDSDALAERWEDFIHTHHYRTCASFNDSVLAQFPRRTCNALFSAIMNCDPREPRPFPANPSWSELADFLEPLLQAEREQGMDCDYDQFRDMVKSRHNKR